MLYDHWMTTGMKPNCRPYTEYEKSGKRVDLLE